MHAGQVLHCDHWVPLVVLSYTISVLGSYCALQWAAQIRRTSGWHQGAWVAGAAVAMGGGGIWSMHFIAMIACRLPLAVAYDPLLTVGSLAVAIAVTGFGLYLVGVAPPDTTRLLTGGTVTGLGVAAMHYTGMAAMELAARPVYSPPLVVASIAIAVVAATAALWIAFNTRRGVPRALASLIMGGAVCGMHYTAMAAVTFYPDDRPVASLATLERDELGFMVFGVTLFVLGLLSLGSHLTDRRRNEEALRRAHDELERLVAERTADLETQRAFLRQVLDTSPGFIFAKDRGGRFTLVNRAVADAYGTTVEELVGKTDADFNPNTDEVAAFLAADRRVMDSREELFIPEEKITDSKGEVRWLQTTKRPIVDDDGVARQVLGVSTDVTARRELEERLRQSQKLEAIGTLAGGVAHDFNNLLMVVLGYSEALLQGLGPDAPERGKVEEIRTAGRRAASLTKQLMAFSRKQAIRPRVLDLDALVADMETMLRRLIGENVDVAIVRRPRLDGAQTGHVLADAGQVEQLVLNLVVNARDAMPRGGRVTIATADVDLDGTPSRGRGAAAKAGAYVRLSVADTGCGMDEATRARIFEPFFTTKGPGHGTGLGLATVYGIVQQSRGFVEVTSEPGRGARFDVYLPRVDRPVDDVAAAPATSAGGSETVLLVEDEQSVRELVDRMLRDGGYRVLVAADADEALAVSRRHDGPIHLLVTDVVMPRRSGPDLARRLLADRPDVRVLFISGHTAEALGLQGALEPGTTLLEKPFTPQSLGERVREVLDRAAVVEA